MIVMRSVAGTRDHLVRPRSFRCSGARADSASGARSETMCLSNCKCRLGKGLCFRQRR